MKRSYNVNVGTFLLIFFACFGSGNSSSAEPSPTLLVVEKSKAFCQFIFQSPASNKSEPWFSLPECLGRTENLIFDPLKYRALILQKGKYSEVNLKPGAKPTIIAEAYSLPSGDDSYVVSTKTWIDRSTDRLRVAYLIELPKDTKKKEFLDWVQKHFPMLNRKEETEISDSGGLPSIALVAEFGSNGKWKEIGAKFTTSQSGDALGLAPVNALILEKAEVVSWQDLLYGATCSQQECTAHTPKFSKKVESWAGSKFKRDEESGQAWSYIPMNETDGYVSGVSFGDTLHWVRPIFYCKGSFQSPCETHTELSMKEEQIGISVKGPYVLITKEYDGTSARLFKGGSKGAVQTFKPDAIVAWMPFSPW